MFCAWSLQVALDMCFRPTINEPYKWTFNCSEAEQHRRHDFYSSGVSIPRKK